VPSVWGARPDAAPADVANDLESAFCLCIGVAFLIKELKDAERLGRDTTEG